MGAGWPQGVFSANVPIALLAAGSWGGGDFAGGMGVKVSGGGTLAALRVIAVAHGVSLAVLAVIYLVTGGGLPHSYIALWAVLAGVIAGVAIAAFYLALARGAMGVPAAISGLLAAALPAVASTFLESRPSATQLAGFVVAGAAIWLIAAAPASPSATPNASTTGTLLLAVLGGVGFGAYFLLLRLANPLGVVLPTMLARTGSVTTCLLLFATLQRGRAQPQSEKEPYPSAFRWTGLSPKALRWTLLASLLDTGGNLLFVTSTRLGRLDVTSVLASLYPAGTILLAALVLHERPARQQLLGMGLALAAVVLVAR